MLASSAASAPATFSTEIPVGVTPVSGFYDMERNFHQERGAALISSGECLLRQWFSDVAKEPGPIPRDHGTVAINDVRQNYSSLLDALLLIRQGNQTPVAMRPTEQMASSTAYR